ncbi:MAG: ribose 5-phosphate isomerase A, partial [Acidimicrobiia bacterium]
MTDDPRIRQKQEAGERAVDWIASGMTVGLGTGSTAIWAIRRIGALLASGELHDIVGVPTSKASEAAARELGIPVVDLDGDVISIDVTVDGADEVDPALNLIKGAGGALLHEKIVAQASRREVIVVDGAKP